MIHSPLAIGQIIHPSEDAKNKVWDIVEINEKENLARGLLCEYAHNEAFVRAGWKFDLTETTNIYDRKFQGLLQDDKLATIDKYGKLSPSHTISADEWLVWSKLADDVIIHSFEEIGDAANSSRYCGAFSFKLLVAHDAIKLSTKKAGQRYFYRDTARKVAWLDQETGPVIPASC